MKLIKRIQYTEIQLHRAESPQRFYALERQFDRLLKRYYKAHQRCYSPVHILENWTGWGRHD